MNSFQYQHSIPPTRPGIPKEFEDALKDADIGYPYTLERHATGNEDYMPDDDGK